MRVSLQGPAWLRLESWERHGDRVGRDREDVPNVMDDHLETPQTAASRLAVEVARRFYPASLFNHCMRSYLFARDDANRQGVEPDLELLFVTAMLHDLALTDVFDSATVPFEEAGGQVGWVFAAGAGWSPERRDRVAEVIERHMWDSVPVELDVEGLLLERATSLDISGRNAGLWSEEFTARVVSAFPRLDLAQTFADCFDAQALRKPESRAASAARNGIRARLESNPLNAH
jgi:HD superfamily phosphodiesterase